MAHRTRNKLTRRTVLAGMSAAGIGAALMPSILRAAPNTGGNPFDAREVINASHWGVITARVEGGRFVKAIPHRLDHYPSAMIEALPDSVYSPVRVRYPMVRKGFLEKGHKSDTTERGKGEFVRVSWDKALDLVASELKRVKETHGNGSILGNALGWKSNSTFYNVNYSLLHRMLNLNGGFVDDVASYSTGAIQLILPYVGADYNRPSAWPGTIKNTELMVFWGSDPLLNSKIGGEAPDHSTFEYVRQYKASGKPSISIDPVRNRTAEYLGSRWVQVRPTTDVALMLGMAHTLLVENLHDKKFLDEYTTGFDKFADYLTGKTDGTPKTAEWAAAITGVEAGVIKELVRLFKSKRTFITMGWSTQRQDHGEQAPWMCFTLGCMLGQIGLPGGGVDFAYHMANYGAPKTNAPALTGVPTGKMVEGMPGPFPCARVHWCMANPGKTLDFNGKSYLVPDIKLVYWVGGNPFHHHQDVNQMIKSWQRPETIIVNEIYWTQTARFSDIVLPVVTTFERNDIKQVGPGGRAIVAMKKVIEPLFEAKNDYEVFAEISKRLGFADKYTEGRDEMAWIRLIYDRAREAAAKSKIEMPDFDAFWGGEGVTEFQATEKAMNYVQYEDFRKDPLVNPLPTPSGKFEIYSRKIESYKYEDCPAHPAWMEPVERLGGANADKFPLHVVTAHPDDRLHAQLNHTWLRNRYEVQGREPIWMNPKDAGKRGIQNGDVVRVFNERGQLLAGAVLSDNIMENCVRLCEGAWYDPAEPGVAGTLCKHGHVNVVTIDKGTSKLAQGTIGNMAMVQIERFDKPLPPITTFTPPDAGNLRPV